MHLSIFLVALVACASAANLGRFYSKPIDVEKWLDYEFPLQWNNYLPHWEKPSGWNGYWSSWDQFDHWRNEFWNAEDWDNWVKFLSYHRYTDEDLRQNWKEYSKPPAVFKKWWDSRSFYPVAYGKEGASGHGIVGEGLTVSVPAEHGIEGVVAQRMVGEGWEIKDGKIFGNGWEIRLPEGFGNEGTSGQRMVGEGWEVKDGKIIGDGWEITDEPLVLALLTQLH